MVGQAQLRDFARLGFVGNSSSSGRGKNSSVAPGGKPASTGAGPQGKPPRQPGVSAKVYRRRRLVVAVLTLLVVAAVVAGIFLLSGFLGGGSKNDAQPAVVGNSPTEKAKPAAKAGTQPSDVCDEAGIKVKASVDKPSYGPDDHPVLTLQVTNSGKTHCDINVGTSQMEFLITSGEDIIFNSAYCQMESTDLVKNLAPGASEKANFVWQQNRTAPDCAKVVSQPGRGGATYVLVATLGKWSSEKVTFTLT